jgi:hypothetical protein
MKDFSGNIVFITGDASGTGRCASAFQDAFDDADTVRFIAQKNT